MTADIKKSSSTVKIRRVRFFYYALLLNSPAAGYSSVRRSPRGPNAAVERLLPSTWWKNHLITIHWFIGCLLVTVCFTDPTFLLNHWSPCTFKSFSISAVDFLPVLSKMMMMLRVRRVCWNAQDAESKASTAKAKGRAIQISPGSSDWIY